MSKAKHYLALAPLVLASLFLLIASAAPKFFWKDPAFVASSTSLLGSMNILYGIGVIEVLCAVFLLIPRTRTLGFLMSVGLLGGATATGLTTNVEGMIWWFPLVILALICVTAYFTLPELLDRAKGKSVPNTKSLTLRIIGWVFVVMILALHVFALMGKINPPAEGTPEHDMVVRLGMAGLEMPLLIVELVTLVLFLVPRTSTLGAIMMIGYMGGVLATFLSHDLNDPAAPVQVGRFAASVPGIVMLVVVALAVWIRNPELATRLFKGKYPAKA